MRTIGLAGIFIVRVLAQSTPSLEQGTVEGRVRNSVTQVGIAGAVVKLKTSRVDYTAKTDDAGAFRVENMKDGDYSVSFDKPGYFPIRTDRPMQRIRVSGKDAVRLDGELTPAGSISGRVVDADGKPAAKIPVQLGAYGARGVTTDEEGAFVLDNLMPGDYSPIAKPKPEIRIQDGARIETVPTYFPSEIEEAEAGKITVQGGAEASGYEIRLRTAAVHRVRGVVLDPAGKPAPGVPVMLLKAPGGGNENVLESDSEGLFEFPSVRPGEWMVHALEFDPAPHSACGLNGGAPASVSKRDIDDIEIRLAPSFTLDVSADWGDAQPPANYKPNVMLLALEGQPCSGLGNVFPGRYKILVQPIPRGFYPASVLLEGREVLGQPVELRPGIPPLRIIFKNDGGKVQGTVENGEGAIVHLIPQRDDDPIFWLAAGCGPGGAFTFNDVAPGDYYAAAFEQIDLTSRALISTILARAARVRVDSKSVATVDLRVLQAD